MSTDYLESLQLFINTFVERQSLDRLAYLLSKRTRYHDFLHELTHDFGTFNHSLIVHKGANIYNTTKVMSLMGLSMKSVQYAYLIGKSPRFSDGDMSSSIDLLDDVIGSMTDSIVFLPKKLCAYYEGHEGFGLILKS